LPDEIEWLPAQTVRYRPYLSPVEDARDPDIDYSVLQKVYAAERTQRRFPPWPCASAVRQRTTGSLVAPRQGLSGGVPVSRIRRGHVPGCSIRWAK